MGAIDEWRTALRVEVYVGDAAGVVRTLAPGVSDEVLQLAGDGALVALAERVDEAGELARCCAAALRARDWEGDDELAEQLEGALGLRPVPLLRRLPVDLDELSCVLEGDPARGGGRIDLRTGEVWPQAAVDYEHETGGEDDDDPDQWLEVLCEGSAAGYRDLEDFIDTIPDDDLAARLAHAISGQGAFGRFKDVLAHTPEQLERYYAFSDERRRGRARAWLATEGYSPRKGLDNP
jgi:hypothetical protein